jgi:hypothetical protein
MATGTDTSLGFHGPPDPTDFGMGWSGRHDVLARGWLSRKRF